MLSYFDRLLGSRGWDGPFEPGFMRLHPEGVERFALILPAVVEALNTLISNRNKFAYGGKRFIKAIQFTYVRKPGENPFLGRKRIIRNYIITSGLTVAFVAGVIGTIILIKKGMIAKAENWLGSLQYISVIKSIEDAAREIILTHSKHIVYTGYSLIGLGHTGMAVYQYKHSKIRLVKHIAAGIVACVSPIVMAENIYETRWHHMSYGQLCLMPSLNALNFLGSYLVCDSMLYWIKPMKDNFDFSDIFIMHLNAFIIQIVVLTIFQKCRDKFFNFEIRPEPQAEEMRLLSEIESMDVAEAQISPAETPEFPQCSVDQSV